MEQIATWAQAEQFALTCMRSWGFPDARLTPPGADEGIDIRGSDLLVQVKFRAGTVGRPDLQRLFGARGTGTQQLFFWALGGYSPQAIQYAREHNIGLFTFAKTGRVTAETPAADKVMPRSTGSPVSVGAGYGSAPTAGAYLAWPVLAALLAFGFVFGVIVGNGDGERDYGAAALAGGIIAAIVFFKSLPDVD